MIEILYLLLAIICSTAIALIFKYSEDNQLNRYLVTSANYLTATLISLIMIVTMKAELLAQLKFKQLDFSSQFLKVVRQGRGQFSATASFLWAVIVGTIAGFFFFLGFIYYQKSVNQNNTGLTGAFAKLGILVPMSASIILWQELPTPVQWIGIILSLAAIIVTNFSWQEFDFSELRLSLLLLFLFGGLAEFSNKVFQKYAVDHYKAVFLFCVFFTAFIISSYFTIRSKTKLELKEIMTGISVGIPNLFSSFFLIRALKTVKTAVAFPIYSALTIVLISIASLVLFKEELKKKDTTAIAMTVLALVLINLK